MNDLASPEADIPLYRPATVAQALAHPTWDMGRVVTTNSATLVNKGLEVICLLYTSPSPRD